MINSKKNSHCSLVVKTLVMLLTGYTAAFAQPTITSFTPISGPIGTTVIITGTNFDTTPANNIVMFNGTAATVTASTSTSITATVPTGATTGPISVTVGGNTATSATNFTVAPFNISYTAPLRLTVGATPREVVVGDVDGDGHLDLINSNFGSGNVSYFKGIGNGCFVSTQYFNTGPTSHGLALADLNQDSKLDLVVTKGAVNSSSLSVLLSNGTTFNPQTDYSTSPTPRSPKHVNVGDINKDGWPDLIVANENPSGSFSVLFNNGDGTFATGVDFPSGNGTTFFVASDDVNGDTYPDVAIASNSSGTASIYINNGLGGFLAETTYPSAAGAHYVVLKDLNGDGRSEMIVANAAANSISVFMNNGSGLFSAPAIYSTQNYPTTISVADMDNDGKLDLIVGNANSGTITAFPGDGAGGFGAYQSFSVGGLPYSVATGDFDEDGKLDIVSVDLSGNKVTVLRSLGNSTCIPSIATFTPTSGPIGTTVTITGTNFDATPSNNIVYFGATRATVTVATATQLTVTVPTGATYQPITVQVGGLTAYSSKPFVVTFAGGGSIDACSFAPKVNFAAGMAPFELAVADFDGDGKPDVALVNRGSKTLLAYRNTSTTGVINSTSLDAPISRTTPTVDPLGLVAADMDGDGKPDLVLTHAGPSSTVSVYRNTSATGSLSFDNRVEYATGFHPIKVAVNDLDGDGKPEIVVCNRFGNSVSILKNTSATGGFTASSFAPKVDFTVGVEPYGVAIADLDADGKPDIVTANNTSGSVSVLRNTAVANVINTGSFATKVDFTATAGPHGVTLADVDGDDKPDIIVTTAPGNILSILRNVTTSGITAGSFASKVDFSSSSNPIISDIDGDGKVDIVATSIAGNMVSAFRNTAIVGTISATSLAPPVDFSSGSSGLTVMADLDGDGKAELITTDYLGNSLAILRNVIGEISSPTIISFTPAGVSGDPVTITGTNFITPFASSISFNGVAAPINSITPTEITTTVPPGATTGPIEITIGCNTVTSSVFCMLSAPTAIGNSGCSGTAIILSASGASPGQYRWYTVATGGTPIAGQTNDTYLTLSLTSTTSYFVSINDGPCESTRTEVIATVIPLPTAPGVQPVNPVCPGSNITLTASGTTDGNYRWYEGGTPLTGEVNALLMVANVTGSRTIQAAIFDGTCESNRTGIAITIKNCTPPVIAPVTTTTFIEGTVTINLCDLISDAENDLDASSIQALSTLTSSAPFSISGCTLTINYAGVPFPGTDRLTIQACDQTGLCTEQEVSIELGGEITVYNALSPNGDGKNDNFYIQYIDVLPEAQQNRVTIYNRWGDVVWSASDYNNTTVVFKGVGTNDKELPTGTYFYKLEFATGKPRTGFISLKR